MTQRAAAWQAWMHEHHDLTATEKLLVEEGAQCISAIDTARTEREELVVDGRYANSSRLNPLVVAESRARNDLLRVLSALGQHHPTRITDEEMAALLD